jgi:hypothetical protein
MTEFEERGPDDQAVDPFATGSLPRSRWRSRAAAGAAPGDPAGGRPPRPRRPVRAARPSSVRVGFEHGHRTASGMLDGPSAARAEPVAPATDHNTSAGPGRGSRAGTHTPPRAQRSGARVAQSRTLAAPASAEQEAQQWGGCREPLPVGVHARADRSRESRLAHGLRGRPVATAEGGITRRKSAVGGQTASAGVWTQLNLTAAEPIGPRRRRAGRGASGAVQAGPAAPEGRECVRAGRRARPSARTGRGGLPL